MLGIASTDMELWWFTKVTWSLDHDVISNFQIILNWIGASYSSYFLIR